MRLTKDVKRHILSRSLNEITKKEHARLKAKINSFQVKMYEVMYPASVRNWMAKGPNDAFTQTHLPDFANIKIKYLGTERVTSPTFKLFPKDTHWNEWPIPKSLEKAGKALHEEVKVFSDNYVEIRAKISSALEACTTVKMLVETYPEFKKYAPTEAKGQHLAIRPQDITIIFKGENHV
jgi:hypothetical protein